MQESAGNAMWMLSIMPRNMRLEDLRNNTVDANGRELKFQNEPASNNPYWTLNNLTNNDEKHHIISFLSSKVELANWLNLKVQTGIDYNNLTTHEHFAPGSSEPRLNIEGGLTNIMANNIEWNSDFMFNAKKDISDKISTTLNFGDGTTSTEMEPVHVYSKGGLYTVSLEVTGPGGQRTKEKSFEVAIPVEELIAGGPGNTEGKTWILSKGYTAGVNGSGSVGDDLKIEMSGVEEVLRYFGLKDAYEDEYTFYPDGTYKIDAKDGNIMAGILFGVGTGTIVFPSSDLNLVPLCASSFKPPATGTWSLDYDDYTIDAFDVIAGNGAPEEVTFNFNESDNKVARLVFSEGHFINYLTEVESKSGNLFYKLGHHGPAVENQWLGFRLYFNKKTAIDVYSKAKPGLEIRQKKWYPSKNEQMAGWGADCYKVGKTLGLGGIKLWDGKKVVPLHPVSLRSAKVVKGENASYVEMLSEGVSYRGEKVNILIRVTVFAGKREAKVEAFSQTGEPVQFATGINYFKDLEVDKQDNYIATWGIHPEDVAVEKVKIGAALLFNKNDFERQLDDGNQYFLISKPTKTLETWITSANAREPEINTFHKFIEHLKQKK